MLWLSLCFLSQNYMFMIWTVQSVDLFGYIAGIFVSNEAQSKGIGKKLLNKAKEEYIELSMEVYKNNEKAVCFYERENFVIIKEHTDESTG